MLSHPTDVLLVGLSLAHARASGELIVDSRRAQVTMWTVLDSGAAA